MLAICIAANAMHGTTRCVADYETAAPCCGQPGDPVESTHQCPAEAPKCAGYVFGKRLGTCGGAPQPEPAWAAALESNVILQPEQGAFLNPEQKLSFKFQRCAAGRDCFVGFCLQINNRFEVSGDFEKDLFCMSEDFTELAGMPAGTSQATVAGITAQDASALSSGEAGQVSRALRFDPPVVFDVLPSPPEELRLCRQPPPPYELEPAALAALQEAVAAGRRGPLRIAILCSSLALGGQELLYLAQAASLPRDLFQLEYVLYVDHGGSMLKFTSTGVGAAEADSGGGSSSGSSSSSTSGGSTSQSGTSGSASVA
jgi:hypothetical protein